MLCVGSFLYFRIGRAGQSLCDVSMCLCFSAHLFILAESILIRCPVHVYVNDAVLCGVYALRVSRASINQVQLVELIYARQTHKAHTHEPGVHFSTPNLFKSIHFLFYLAIESLCPFCLSRTFTLTQRHTLPIFVRTYK